MLFLYALLFAPIWASSARLGATIASEGDDMPAYMPLVTAGLVGGMGIAVFASGLDVYSQLVTIALGGGLLVAAVLDRETGWAPDTMMWPIVVLACMLGALNKVLPFGPITAIAVGTCTFWACQVVWMICARIAPVLPLPPPGDLIALALPLVFLGVCLGFVMVMLGICILLLGAKFNQKVARIFTKGHVAKAVISEMDFLNETAMQPVTLLALAFPVVWVALLCQILM